MTYSLQAGSLYTVQSGDTLSGIAQQAYGDSSEAAWKRIYTANQQGISDPNRLYPGELIYIPVLHPSKTLCTVTVETLNVRAAPTSQSALVASYPRGSFLNFVDVVMGENVNGQPLWGYSEQGHYFWLGGTNSPIGNQQSFAAIVENSGIPVKGDAGLGDNATAIYSAVDRPGAKFIRTVLNVPPWAKGAVGIQNDSANPETLVSDTPNGFAPFTIAPHTVTSLLFRRIGTFQAHLKDYPVSADTTLTIIITTPFLD